MTQPVLFVAADLPWPPDGGGRIATLRVLEGMAADRPVDLIALADVERPDLTALRRICRRITVVSHPFTFGRHPVRQTIGAVTAAIRGRAYRLEKFRDRGMRKAIDAATAAERYAVVHHDQFGVATYRDPRFPSTLTTQNIESDIYARGAVAAHGVMRRGWARREAAALRRAEPALYGAFDHVFALSEHDVALLRAMGIDRTTRLPIPMPTADADPPVPDGRIVLSLGSMSWFGVEDGLLWFHREVWPRVRAAVPDAQWRLVGPNAGPALRRLHGRDGVTVVGYVDDAEVEIRAARVAIVPLHVAGGIRIKLLQLLAMGRPAVATSVGATGLDAPDGAGCFVRDDPRQFATAVVRLLVDDEHWRATGAAGRRHLAGQHSEAAIQTAIRHGLAAAIEHHHG